ncbi:MAG: methyltransferase domain-containing protein [Verrucomicrobiaceae bacterium]|nr:methyltransferase domain-containing protein [Verrucomicrobiaceae bacterium]
MNPYDSQELLDQYLLFHYGSPEEILPYPGGPGSALDFPRRSVVENIDTTVSRRRALDLGCAVGRSSFELSVFCSEVVGIDSSEQFVAAAEYLRKRPELAYRRLEEGVISTELVARRPEYSNPERIRFETGDALNLDEGLGDFDVLHAANLVCRLPEPEKFLARLKYLVTVNGLLILTTPCTWLGEFTRPSNWPAEATHEWLANRLSGSFNLLNTKDMPFLIREHARKYQWGMAQASVWRRI